MKHRHLLGIIVLACLLSQSAVSQGIALSIVGGISKDSRTQTENLWNTGLNVAAHGFISLPGLTLGGRIAYHSWSVDGEGWLKELDPNTTYTYTLKNATGSQTVIELVPSARFAVINPPVGLRVDAQVGAGLFLVSQSVVEVTGSFQAPNVTGEATVRISEQSLTGFGVQAGIPVSFGPIEVIAIYSAYNAGGDWYNHYALNAGIRFGI